MSLLDISDGFDIRASLNYYDHPISANEDEGLDLNLGTHTKVKVTIEEVRKQL